MAAPSWAHRRYLDTQADLHVLGANLAGAHLLAIDAEFSQVRARAPDGPTHRLALVQLAYDDGHDASYVVDALRLRDLSPLRAPLADGRILKLFHGVGSDVRVLATRDLTVNRTLDLEAVSRSIFGQRESGLQAMLRRACGVHLDKSLQRADWSRRPLTGAMVAYAARDAEMTFVLYHWLSANYAWAVALHEVPADEPPPAMAPWVLAFVEGSRTRSAEMVVHETGLEGKPREQERDLRAALAAARHPGERVRVLRLSTDLGLSALAPDARPLLDSPASEERAAALRSIGRLRDLPSEERVRALLADPVGEVRQAARLAIEFIRGTATPPPPRALRRSGTPLYTSGGASPRDAAPPADERWAALRARFNLPSGDAEAPDAE